MINDFSLVLRRWAFLCFLLPSYLVVSANDRYDSLEISLLTCSPHDEIYSLYGHTAIRLKDDSQGFDMVVNYGLFDTSVPNFGLRFAFGLTDYRMGISSFELFKQEYQYYGSEVVQQKLNITSEEKSRIMKAIELNALPENVVYRYNYFFDNCTTRARDMLVSHLTGSIRYLSSIDSTLTFRQMVHSCNNDHLWARFGNDMLLGVQADLPTNRKEQQFLPKNLMHDFAEAVIVMPGDSVRKLISEESIVIPAGVQVSESGFPLSPTTCALLLLILIIFVVIIERIIRKVFWGLDLFLMLTAGLSGILIFMMIFSQHPTVRINFQLLLLNPLPLFFIYPVVRNIRRKQTHIWWKIWIVLIILFFFGRIFQQYAEGMMILALTLLIRCVSHVFYHKRNTKS